MANIMFTWELGGGSGHVAPYIELVRLLEKAGHQITYVLRDLSRANRFFEGTNVRWLQTPIGWPLANGDRPKATDSFAKILSVSGFSNTDQLSARIKAWQNIYQLARPDLIIFDYSPTAILASRGLGIQRLAIGTGFHLPPDTRPIPDLRWHLRRKSNPEMLMNYEQRVLKTCNEAAARTGLPPLEQLSDLYQVDTTVFRTFPEMDHYPGREKADYWGVFNAPAGDRPEWPAGKGKKVFGYLKRFKTLRSLLTRLNEHKLPTLIYSDSLPADTITKFSSDTLRFVDRPIDMAYVAENADLAVTNAGHGTSCELLAAGVPALMLPLNLEQQIVAANVVKLGAGLSAPRLLEKGISQKLGRMLGTDEYTIAAKMFASRYADKDPAGLSDRLLKLVQSLLPLSH